MLYCPKCQRNYEESSQRFCLTDGTRLLPLASGENAPKKAPVNVFSSILEKGGSEKKADGKSGKKEKTLRKELSKPKFEFPSNSKIFKNDPELELLGEDRIPAAKPIFGSLNLGDILSVQTIPDAPPTIAEEQLQNSKDNDALVGKIVKDRFEVIELIRREENVCFYLGIDKTASDKKVEILVVTDEDRTSSGAKISEAAKSLLELNHPNLANILDTGEFAGGKTLLVSEFVEGVSLKDLVRESGQLNAARTARLIRQAAAALGALHQKGFIQRELKPENIVSTVNADGVETIKLTNYGLINRNPAENEFLFTAPEVIEGKEPTEKSELYSLGAITYQLLTARLPFNGETESDWIKAQRAGIKLQPTHLRLDVPPAIDEVLEKALAYNSTDRFADADAFSAALSEVLADEKSFAEPIETAEESLLEIGDVVTKPVLPPIDLSAAVIGEQLPFEEKPMAETASESESAAVRKISMDEVKASEDLAWERRSIETRLKRGWTWALFPIFGTLLLLGGLWGVWYYFLSRSTSSQIAQTTNNPNDQPNATETTINDNVNVTPVTPLLKENEVPPLPRHIKQPLDSVYFENSRENLDKNLLRNFRGFSLYYPKGWKKNNAENKFIDISNNAPTGTPIEQLLISYYPSEGTFTKDADKFPKIVQESNEDLKNILPNYSVISEGETVVNNGWRAYQVKFKSEGKTANGETIPLGGRRLFIPAARPGVQSGFVITLLATSLSKDVKSVEDVGVKGELADILYTFEPNQNY